MASAISLKNALKQGKKDQLKDSQQTSNIRPESKTVGSITSLQRSSEIKSMSSTQHQQNREKSPSLGQFSLKDLDMDKLYSKDPIHVANELSHASNTRSMESRRENAVVSPNTQTQKVFVNSQESTRSLQQSHRNVQQVNENQDAKEELKVLKEEVNFLKQKISQIESNSQAQNLSNSGVFFTSRSPSRPGVYSSPYVSEFNQTSRNALRKENNAGELSPVARINSPSPSYTDVQKTWSQKPEVTAQNLSVTPQASGSSSWQLRITPQSTLSNKEAQPKQTYQPLSARYQQQYNPPTYNYQRQDSNKSSSQINAAQLSSPNRSETIPKTDRVETSLPNSTSPGRTLTYTTSSYVPKTTSSYVPKTTTTQQSTQYEPRYKTAAISIASPVQKETTYRPATTTAVYRSSPNAMRSPSYSERGNYQTQTQPTSTIQERLDRPQQDRMVSTKVIHLRPLEKEYDYSSPLKNQANETFSPSSIKYSPSTVRFSTVMKYLSPYQFNNVILKSQLESNQTFVQNQDVIPSKGLSASKTTTTAAAESERKALVPASFEKNSNADAVTAFLKFTLIAIVGISKILSRHV